MKAGKQCLTHFHFNFNQLLLSQSHYMRKLGYSIGPEKKPHSLTIQEGTKVTPLLLLFHYCAQLLSASVPRQPK